MRQSKVNEFKSRASRYKYHIETICSLDFQIKQLTSILEGVTAISYEKIPGEAKGVKDPDNRLEIYEKLDRLKQKKEDAKKEIAYIKEVIDKCQGDAQIYMVELILLNKKTRDIAKEAKVLTSHINTRITDELQRVLEKEES